MTWQAPSLLFLQQWALVLSKSNIHLHSNNMWRWVIVKRTIHAAKAHTYVTMVCSIHRNIDYARKFIYYLCNQCIIYSCIKFRPGLIKSNNTCSLSTCYLNACLHICFHHHSKLYGNVVCSIYTNVIYMLTTTLGY